MTTRQLWVRARKRSDITDDMVVAACRIARRDTTTSSYEQLKLATAAPRKLVLAAMHRAADHGRIQYGVSIETAWEAE